MQVAALKCKKCGDIVYSRCRHDMRFCTCKAIAIDGGRDYCRVCGYPDDIEFLSGYKVKATKDQMYNDWNKKINKLGLIKNEQSKKPNPN